MDRQGLQTLILAILVAAVTSGLVALVVASEIVASWSDLMITDHSLG